MKLYYSAGSCSTSCHITLEESGLTYQAVEVDWDNATDPNVALVSALNPQGTLPVMMTDSGKVLSQNIAIHTYVAGQVPGKNLLPAAGTIEHAEAMNWLSFVASDLHKAFSPLFGLAANFQDEKTQGAVRNWALQNVQQCLATLNKGLENKEFLTGKNFTIADAYCFVVVGWCQWLNISLEPYKNVQAYLGRVAQRPAVHKVLKEEGLLEQ